MHEYCLLTKFMPSLHHFYDEMVNTIHVNMRGYKKTDI